jgi:hypothetical protein
VFNKAYTTKKAMIEDNKEERTKIIKEINILNKDIKKDKKMQLILIIIFLIFLFILFKIFIGQINIVFDNSTLSFNKARLYNVKINNVLVNSGGYDFKITSIIPKTFNIINFDFNIPNTKIDNADITYELGSEINLTIESYECYNKKKKLLSCENKSVTNKKLTNDTTYEMKILKDKTKVVYEGKFLNEISSYLTEVGIYYISFIGKYKKVTSTINIKIEITEKDLQI